MMSKFRVASQLWCFSLLSFKKCELVNTPREVMIHYYDDEDDTIISNEFIIHYCYFQHSKQKTTDI